MSSSSATGQVIGVTFTMEGEYKLYAFSYVDNSFSFLLHDTSFPLYARFIQVRDQVFVFGGQDVKIFDMPSNKVLDGPPLPAPKLSPITMVLGDLLFVFSRKIWDFYPSSDPLEPGPCGVVMRLGDAPTWHAVLSPKDVIPTPVDSDDDCVFDDESDIMPFKQSCFIIAAYVVCPSIHALMISLAETYGDHMGSCTLVYYVNDIRWSFSTTPLPFCSEGKCIGDICFGFVSLSSNHISSFRLVDGFSFDEIATYHFPWDCPSVVPRSYEMYSRTFVPLSDTEVAITRALKFHKSGCRGLVVDVFHLPMHEESSHNKEMAHLICKRKGSKVVPRDLWSLTRFFPNTEKIDGFVQYSM